MIKEDAVLRIYPNARPNIDFYIVHDEETGEDVIEGWQLSVDMPTDAELQAAWEDLQNNPPPRVMSKDEEISSLKDEVASLNLAIIDLWEILLG